MEFQALEISGEEDLEALDSERLFDQTHHSQTPISKYYSLK